MDLLLRGRRLLTFGLRAYAPIGSLVLLTAVSSSANDSARRSLLDGAVSRPPAAEEATPRIPITEAEAHQQRLRRLKLRIESLRQKAAEREREDR